MDGDCKASDAQDPSRPEPQSSPAVKTSEAGGANTKGRSLTHSAFWEAFSLRAIKQDQAWQQTISWESCQVITPSVKQNIYCLMKLSLSPGKQRLDRCGGGGVETRWARLKQSKKMGKNFKLIILYDWFPSCKGPIIVSRWQKTFS